MMERGIIEKFSPVSNLLKLHLNFSRMTEALQIRKGSVKLPKDDQTDTNSEDFTFAVAGLHLHL